MTQVVWFFEEPTVMACPFCERIAAYYTEVQCKECGRDMVYFTATMEEVQASLESVPD